MREFQLGDKVRIRPEWLDHLRSEHSTNEWCRRGRDYIYEIVEVDPNEDEVYPYKLSCGSCWWGASKLILANEVQVSVDVSALI